MTMTSNLLLMAAGNSLRFKAQSGQHKLLYPIAHQTILEQTYATVHSIFPKEHIHIITNQAENEVCQLALTFGSPVLQIQSHGLGESIAQGIQHIMHNRHSDNVLILHADLPFIQPTTIQAVLNAAAHFPIVRPSYQGKAGHPVSFQKHLYPELINLQGDQGAQKIISKHPHHLLMLDDKGSINDIDRPEDIKRYYYENA